MSDDQAKASEDYSVAAPDADDVLAARAPHDAAAFADLYERHYNRVYRYLLARIGDVEQAQDLTHQTFLAALRDIDGYRGPRRFVAWLMTIAHHSAVDHFRRSRRRATVPLETAAHLADPSPSLDHVIAVRLHLEQVAQALRTLTPERAEALALRIFSELSVAEVAQVMGKSEAAVRMLVHRAVCDLRERLALSNEGEP